MSSGNSLRRAALLSYLTVAFGVLSGLIYTPWMIRTIGASDFAIYSLLLSVVSLVAVDLGLGAATSRFLTLYIARRDRDGEQNFLTAIVKVFVFLAMFMAVALSFVYLLAPRLYPALTDEQLTSFRSVLLVYGLYSVVAFPFGPLDGVLLANEKLVQLKGLGLLQKALTLVLMVVALLLGYGLHGLVAANIAGGALLALLKFRVVLRSTSVRPQWRRKSRAELGSVLDFSVWTTVISISQRLIINIQPSVLAALSGVHGVALFSIATTIEGYVFAVAGGINGLLLPRVTRLTVTAEDSTAKIQELMERVGRLQLYLLGTIACGFLLLGAQFMDLWVGPRLAASYPVAAVLLLPAVVIATLNVAETALIASGRIRNVAFASLTAAAISLPLSILLASHLDALGSAFAVFFGAVVGRIAYVTYVYGKHLGLKMGQFFRDVYVKTVPWLLASTLLGWLAGNLVPGEGWGSFLARGTIYLVCVVVLLLSFAFTPSERALFNPKNWR